MAPNTAVCFVLLGVALWLLRSRAWAWAGQRLALVVGLVGYVVVTGYVYEASALVGIAQFIPMALPTALAFMAVAIAVVTASPDAIVRALVRTGEGARLRRNTTTAFFPCRFALVHGGISLLHQRRGVAAVSGCHAHADADAGVGHEAVACDRYLRCGQDSGRHRFNRRVVADSTKDHDELVTGQACDRVGGANGIGLPHRELFQHLIAGLVAPGVVDLFEAIEVQEHDRDPGRRAIELGQRMAQPIFEQAAPRPRWR